MNLKDYSERYSKAFEKALASFEKKLINESFRYYQSEYYKAVEYNFRVARLNSTNVQSFFSQSDFSAIYESIYVEIGLKFANWYYKNGEKYLPKSLSEYQTLWAGMFASYGKQVAARRVTLVSGTAKDTLISVTNKLLADPDYQKLGPDQQARILRKQFDIYSRYQAERLVRTESTNAANYASEVSATTLFEGQDLTKTWITARDSRVRASHQSMNGKNIPLSEVFIVNGEQMKRPGDSSLGASASNVINCRCSLLYIPSEGAQATSGNIENIGFGIGIAIFENLLKE